MTLSKSEKMWSRAIRLIPGEIQYFGSGGRKKYKTRKWWWRNKI